MTLYDIQRTLRAPFGLGQPIQLVGFELSGGGTEPISARSAEDGETWPEAALAFEERLLRVLDAMAVSLGLSLSSYAGALLGARPDLSIAILTAFLPKDVSAVDSFSSDQEDELKKCLSAVEGDEEVAKAARHFREALISESGLDSSLHALRSIEALAGSEEAVRRCDCSLPLKCPRNHEQRPYLRTSRSEIKRIISDTKAFAFYYGVEGHRNALMHGGYERQEQMGAHIRPLLKSVFAEVRSRCSLPDYAHAGDSGLEDSLPVGITVLSRRDELFAYEGSPNISELVWRLASSGSIEGPGVRVLRDAERLMAMQEFG